MSIERITISQYKNISNLDIDFSGSSIPLLIGQNGSGKSNFLEALVIIFKVLYTLRTDDCPFDFSITLLPNPNVEKVIFIKKENVLYLDRYGRRLKFTYSDRNIYIDTVFQSSYVPKHIIVYYLGDSKRIYTLAKKTAQTNQQNNVELYKYSTDSIILIESEMQVAAIIALYLTGESNGIPYDIDKIEISVQKSKSIEFMKSIISSYVGAQNDGKGGSIKYVLNRKSDSIHSSSDIVHAFAKLMRLSVFSNYSNSDKHNINVVINKGDRSMNFFDLSEGEQNIGIIESYALAFNSVQNDALFIMDEPDAFLNPVLQNLLINRISSLTTNQVFISSHSSNILSRSLNHNVFFFEQGKVKKNNLNIYGRDVRVIQQYVQNVNRFPEDVEGMINNFYRFVDQKNYESARESLISIQSVFGETDPYFIELKTIMDLEVMGE